MAALSTIALVSLTAAGTATKYSGQRAQARAARAEGNFAGQMFDRNAEYAREQAADAIARGAEQAHGVARSTKGLMGSQRAALAASGVEVAADDALAVQEQADLFSELDIATIEYNARREAMGFEREAEDYTMRGQMARAGGRNQARALRMGSFGTLLTGAADIAGIGYDRGWFERSGAMSRGLSAARDPATIRAIKRTRYR